MKEFEINEELAKQAKEMNSYDDYKENSATNEYKRYLTEFENNVNELMRRFPQNATPENIERIEYYKEMYSKKLAFAINKSNSIETQMPSYLITGGGNFDVRKKEKQNQARANFWNEYGNLFEENNYYYNKIKTILTSNTIYSDDELAVEKLERRIAELEEKQAKMKDTNALLQKAWNNGRLRHT